MLKYLRDKLFFDLGPTAITDLSRPLRHDFVAAVFTRHATYVACRALLRAIVKSLNLNLMYLVIKTTLVNIVCKHMHRL